MQSKKVSIIIPIINLWFKYTLPCIESLRKQTYKNIEIIVVDNASTDSTDIEIKKQDVIHLRNQINIGCGNAWNQGIKKAIENGSELFFVINNDTLFRSDCLEELVKRMEKGGVGIVTGRDIKGGYQNDKTIEEFLKSTPLEESDNFPDVESPDFSAMLINKKTYEKVGEFDGTTFYPAYFEDNDYHYRMRLLGIKAVNWQRGLYYHFGSKTQMESQQQPIVTSMMFQQNRIKYISKWGGVPGDEKFKLPYNNNI